MFIKLKTLLETDIIVNVDHISTVQRFVTPSQEGCEISFVNNDSIRVLNTIEQLYMLLDIKSIEKIIESLKHENFELQRQQEYDRLINKLVRGEHVAKPNHSQN